MNTVFDFIIAAAPWVAVGLLVALPAVRAASGHGGERDGTYGIEGMCLGLCFGTMLGGENGVGIFLGMLIGLAAGMCIPKKPREDTKR